MLGQVATKQDPSLGLQLSHSPGWQTLLAVLRESGEIPPKRPASPGPGHGVASVARVGDTGTGSNARSLSSLKQRHDSTEHITKKVKGFSLK